MNRLNFGQIDINSIRNEKSNLWNKVCHTFPVSQFGVPGYSVLFRLDRTGKRGGIWSFRMLRKFTFEKEI